MKDGNPVMSLSLHLVERTVVLSHKRAYSRRVTQTFDLSDQAWSKVFHKLAREFYGVRVSDSPIPEV